MLVSKNKSALVSWLNLASLTLLALASILCSFPRIPRTHARPISESRPFHCTHRRTHSKAQWDTFDFRSLDSFKGIRPELIQKLSPKPSQQLYRLSTVRLDHQTRLLFSERLRTTSWADECWFSRKPSHPFSNASWMSNCGLTMRTDFRPTRNSLSVGALAAISFAFVDDRVIRRKGVPTATVRLSVSLSGSSRSHDLNDLTALQIDQVGDGFEVARIDTAGYAASVIQLQTGRNRADVEFVGDTVGEAHSSATRTSVDHAVAFVVQTCEPQPTSRVRLGRNLVEQSVDKHGFQFTSIEETICPTPTC